MRELARRAGVSRTTISDVMSGKTSPTADFCIKIADALQIPGEKVQRLAGVLPPLPPEVEEEQEIITALRCMPASDREAAVKMFRGLVSVQTATPDDVELTIAPAQERQPQTPEERAAAALLDEMEGLTEDEQDEVFRFMKWVRDRRAGVAGATEHVR